MSTNGWTGRIAETSPRLKARLAGALYFFSLLTAASGESFLNGWLNIAAGLVAVLAMAEMTLLLYDILNPVNNHLSSLAGFFAFVGLSFEALRWQPQGVNIALAFHGLYCLLTGYVIFRSNFLPRILGVLTAFAGLGWMTYLFPRVADNLSPWNLAAGLLGDISLFLWLLVIGVSVANWQETSSAWPVRRA